MKPLVALAEWLGLYAAEDVPQRLGAICLLNDVFRCGEAGRKRGVAYTLPTQARVGIVMTQLRTGPSVCTQLRIRSVLAELRAGTVGAVQMGIGAVSAQL